MKAKLVSGEEARVFALVFEPGDEVVAGLLDFARRENLRSAHFSAIGAFERLTFGFFERERKDYKRISFDEAVEVMSLAGNIAQADDGPRVHAHVVVGRRDGTAHGGHLFEGRVWPTLELFLTEVREPLRRRMNEEVGLPLIDMAE